jgi:predicted RNase H-like HicB family nuclease
MEIHEDDELPHIDVEREDDGRWIAEFVELPGVLAYGKSAAEAIARVKALSRHVLADRDIHGENASDSGGID